MGNGVGIGIGGLGGIDLGWMVACAWEERLGETPNSRSVEQSVFRLAGNKMGEANTLLLAHLSHHDLARGMGSSGSDKNTYSKVSK